MNAEHHRKRLDMLKIKRGQIEREIRNTKELIQKIEREKGNELLGDVQGR